MGYGGFLTRLARDSGKHDKGRIQTSGLRLPPNVKVDGLEIYRRVVTCPTYFHGFQPGRWRICVVSKGGMVWMSDSPQEVQLARMDVAKFPGGEHILVVGLGLGIFPQLVAKKYKRITVLEIDQVVADAVWKHVARRNWHLVIGDAWKMDKVFRRGVFDAVYGDIWTGQGDRADDHEEYKRFKRLARYKLGSPKTVCWVEDHVYGRGDWFG